jgi:hypothetical protein
VGAAKVAVRVEVRVAAAAAARAVSLCCAKQMDPARGARGSCQPVC